MIGTRMKQIRKDLKMNRKAMADKLGMSESTLKGWEQENKYPISILWVWNFLKIAGITFEELMEDNNGKTDNNNK